MYERSRSELALDEGIRLFVYDDATGLPIIRGTHVLGHPTIGLGRCLDIHGISMSEAEMMFELDIAGVEHQLAKQDWFLTLNPVRQGVMVNLAFSMGVSGLLQFHDMIYAIRGRLFDLAAEGLSRSKWATQVQRSRSTRLIAQLRSGL